MSPLPQHTLVVPAEPVRLHQSCSEKTGPVVQGSRGLGPGKAPDQAKARLERQASCPAQTPHQPTGGAVMLGSLPTGCGAVSRATATAGSATPATVQVPAAEAAGTQALQVDQAGAGPLPSILPSHLTKQPCPHHSPEGPHAPGLPGPTVPTCPKAPSFGYNSPWAEGSQSLQGYSLPSAMAAAHSRSPEAPTPSCAPHLAALRLHKSSSAFICFVAANLTAPKHCQASHGAQ